MLRVAEATWFRRRQPALRGESATTWLDDEAIRVERSPALIESGGERFATISAENEVELEHVHRYLIAAQLCAGKTVLDAASGEGYGSSLLSQVASRVTGVDLSRAAVEAASLKYERGNLSFRCSSVTELPFEANSFDVVVCLETLEHVVEQEAMLDEFKRVLRPGGTLLISTPDRVNYNRHLVEPNPYHVRELERSEFLQLLRARFQHAAAYGQRVAFGSLLVPEVGHVNPLVSMRRATRNGAVKQTDEYAKSVYIVAVCSDLPLPVLPPSLYEGSIPQNALSSLLGGMDERDRKILNLCMEIATISEHAGNSVGPVKAVSYVAERLEQATREFAAAISNERQRAIAEHRARLEAERALRAK